MEQTAGSARMTKDRIIKELIELLNQSQQKENANNVFEMAAYIDGMEQKIEEVIQELVNIRKQLAEMESRQEKKNVQAVLSGVVENLEQQCQKLKQQLIEVKTEIKVKAAEIVAEAKRKGKAALNKVSEFLGIKDKLKNIRQNVQESIEVIDKSIGKIDALGTGIREAGQKIVNTVRTFADKAEKEYGEKKFSKTELLKKPFQAKRKLLVGILNYVDAAIEKTENLAADVHRQRAEKAAHGLECAEKAELISHVEYVDVAEPEYQYGAEAFEEHQKANDSEVEETEMQSKVPIKNKCK